MASEDRFISHVTEQRFQLLLNAVTDYAIYMLDPGGHVANWNVGAQQIKGYSADEIVGQHFSRFYTEEDRAAGEPARALEVALRAGKYENEAWRVRKDGSRFWASVLIDPVYDEDRRLIGFAKITRDITDRLHAQQELEDARVALFQSQKLQAIGELTGGIAHDFNNLMTVIRGSADLLRRDDLPSEKRKRYLDAIIETADRAATLTSHLLAFGRRQPLKPEVIDLNLRLDAFAEVLSRTIGSGIEVELDLAPSLWPIEVDSSQLETALLNAAFNARDAMPRGGRLVLATSDVSRREGDMVCVALSDTGEGMARDVLERVFEPFFTTKPVGEGTGLGLSQIHGFAAQAGGLVEIDSHPGEGTTVRIFLPRSTKPVPAVRRDDGVRVNGEGKTILIVEDNDHVREFARNLLEDICYRVISAACVDQALSLIERERIDLVFSDVVMPGRSGIELARRVRAEWPHLPLLLTSGHSEEILQGAASEFPLLRKPYGGETLAAAVASALDDAQREGRRMPSPA